MIEKWKDIPGYETLYMVSDIGNVRSLDREFENSLGVLRKEKGRILKPAITRDGYKRVSLAKDKKSKSFFCHALVALAFIGDRPEGLQVCHNDGIKTNNSLKNLRYDTNENNVKDRVSHDGYAIGSENLAAKLKDSLVIEILELMNLGYSATSVAEYFEINSSTIYEIINKRKWKHLKEVQDFKPKHLRRSKTFTGYSSPS